MTCSQSTIYIYIYNFALNNMQGMICIKIKPTQPSLIYHDETAYIYIYIIFYEGQKQNVSISIYIYIYIYV